MCCVCVYACVGCAVVHECVTLVVCVPSKWVWFDRVVVLLVCVWWSVLAGCGVCCCGLVVCDVVCCRSLVCVVV